MAIAGLAACGDAANRLEAARVACTVTIQSLYRPISDKDPVAFEPAVNVAAEPEKFEFVWKQSQIKNLMFVVMPQEIERSGGQVRDNETRILHEIAGA